MTRNGYQHMVLDYYVDRFRDQRAKRQKRLRAIHTREQALAYQKRVDRAIRRCVGPLPRRTPLNGRITGTVERSHHTIHKVLFESRPGCLVTGHLYVPKHLQAPAPAVLGCVGHSDYGKLEPAYQEFCQRLVGCGFVVFIYDPFSQGERDQYWFLEDRDPVLYSMYAHNLMGKQLDLVGEWFGAWRAWDGIRALDFLLDRPEVDSKRVGLTGTSGGGALTGWLWALDRRVTMAAPSCFVSTYLTNLENELPQDYEGYFPGLIGSGLEVADIFIARAPAPVIVLGQRYDFFDARGLQESYQEVERFFDILGAPRENRLLYVGEEGHSYSPVSQEQMVAFFVHHARVKGSVSLPKPERLSAARMNVIASGSVGAAGGKAIYELIAARADLLRQQRTPHTPAQIKSRLADLLQLPARPDSPHYRNLRPSKPPGKVFSRYAVETEAAVRAIVYQRPVNWLTSRTLNVEPEIHLFLPHIAAAEDLATDPLARALAKRYPLYAVDVRGTGESRPDEEAEFTDPYGMDYMMHGHGLMLGESYLGRRVHDVLVTLDVLCAAGAERVSLYGRGQGALLALFAGLLHRSVHSVALKNGPLSYQGWTQVPVVEWPAANFLRGVLAYFDLPDCIRVLGEQVQIIQPWGPDMRPLRGRHVERAVEEAGLSPTLLAPRNAA